MSSTPIEMFDYSLPEELIASYPCEVRDECRLMILDRKKLSIDHAVFKNLPEFLGAEFFLVANDTRVMNARLEAVKKNGGRTEFFITELLPDNRCRALLRGRFSPGDEVTVAGFPVRLLAKDEDGVWTADVGSADMRSVMENEGRVPLPPYISRRDEPSDRIYYQTVYSRNTGSVAAPTAGLHFTDDLLKKLRFSGVEKIDVTLDVGPGTFRPVKTATLEEHVMHAERYEITKDAADRINLLKKNGKKLVAVGSTAVRTLESAWGENGLRSGSSSTRLMIKPGYSFKATDAMITNFHLPKSTLLAMVAAFAGHDFIMSAYRTAVKSGYRFFSYGDAMLII